MRKGIPVTLYLDEGTVALLDAEVQKRAALDRERGLTGYSVANRSKVASEAIVFALMDWKEDGLSIVEIARVTRPIFVEYGIEWADLFGSFARGDQTDESDVDFLVKLGRPMGLSFFGIQQRLEKVLGRSVDVQSVDACDAGFLQAIAGERTNVYAS